MEDSELVEFLLQDVYPASTLVREEVTAVNSAAAAPVETPNVATVTADSGLRNETADDMDLMEGLDDLILNDSDAKQGDKKKKRGDRKQKSDANDTNKKLSKSERKKQSNEVAKEQSKMSEKPSHNQNSHPGEPDSYIEVAQSGRHDLNFHGAKKVIVNIQVLNEGNEIETTTLYDIKNVESLSLDVTVNEKDPVSPDQSKSNGKPKAQSRRKKKKNSVLPKPATDDHDAVAENKPPAPENNKRSTKKKKQAKLEEKTSLEDIDDKVHDEGIMQSAADDSQVNGKKLFEKSKAKRRKNKSKAKGNIVDGTPSDIPTQFERTSVEF
ncbi:uncharacterized protein KNAG_0H00150 [Huiozyma naganishii CBS 8797]|uniref:Uncharacterized protein n=1 Tax=Huiozyma naganishii (strain ATCC MYA-139 / BCRC 22969 / CBS 8797 / KCTC 17520 / NBRC 10181 / NCYC 3082 / Yp74L-3) TaxID=1071383 RepID=J7S9B9_HUIN7|nr:hypothetical protein KNAG_0H00150 [Kazachstania naganishii CBS 8797]CCK71431.1 hypothetical protein KNAG_0H00150 [Kazachstania naganishii CBS 8797]